MGLDIKVESREEVVVLFLRGEIDSVFSQKLRDQIKLLAEGSKYKIIIDMTDLTYLDSSALGAIIAGLKVLDRYGGGMKISGVNTFIEDVFKITRFGEVVDIQPDVTSALEAFKKE